VAEGEPRSAAVIEIRVEGEAPLRLSLAGLPPGEVTRIRQLVRGTTFLDPARRLRELRRYLSAPEKPAEQFVESDKRRKELDEEVDAALFCYGYGRMYGLRTLYVMREEADGDAIAIAIDGDGFDDVRLQVKGIRHPDVSKKTLNEEIAKLEVRYPTSPNLFVVIGLHMSMPYPLKDLEIPPGLRLGGLYVLSATDGRLDRWQLGGDILQEKIGLEEFDYPA